MTAAALPTAEQKPPKLRWYQPTPGRLLILLLVVEGVLLLSERFRWFPFNQHKGWTVLIAIASVGVMLVVMLLWFNLAVLFRWRFQFSLRSFLALMVAIAIPFGWLGVEMIVARRQQQAVKTIRTLGGVVNCYTGEEPPGAMWLHNLLGDELFVNDVEVRLQENKTTDVMTASLLQVKCLRALSLEGTKATNLWLKRFGGFSQLRSLKLCRTDVTDAGLECVEKLVQLEELGLDATPITDVGLKNVAGLTRLRRLGLSGTRVTSAGLPCLRHLTGLQQLELKGTRVTEAGLEILEVLTQLEILRLDDTEITDAGLKSLKGLPKLWNVGLGGTCVTIEGVRVLYDALRSHRNVCFDPYR